MRSLLFIALFAGAYGCSTEDIKDGLGDVLPDADADADGDADDTGTTLDACLLYTSPSPRDLSTSRMPSSA